MTAKGNIKSERLGEKKRQKNGMAATITGYKFANDMTVTFENGRIVEHTSYYKFVHGDIKIQDTPNPNTGKVNDYHVGDQVVCSNNMIATIIAYRRYDDIDVQFEDGVIVRNITFAGFFQGAIAHPTVKALHWRYKNDKNIIGRKRRTVYGYNTLVAFRNEYDLDYVDDSGVLCKHRSLLEFETRHSALIKSSKKGHPFMIDSWDY